MAALQSIHQLKEEMESREVLEHSGWLGHFLFSGSQKERYV